MRERKITGFGWFTRVVFCAALVVLSWVPRGAAGQAPAPEDYRIGPQDVLAVTVHEQPELSKNYTVEIDGTFTFPMIGRIKAAGLTLREFETELRNRLASGFFKNPQVSVSVVEYRSQRVFVMGEVKQPGSYPLTGNMTLLELLARAGSGGPTASSEIVIVRSREGEKADRPVLPGEDETAEVVRVSLEEMQGGRLSQNVALRNGDTIFVPRAEPFFVYGQVRNPGSYPLQRQTTVLQALSLAGGATEFAATNRIKIIRVEDGERKEIKAELTDLVKPGDTIVVPERYF